MNVMVKTSRRQLLDTRYGLSPHTLHATYRQRQTHHSPHRGEFLCGGRRTVLALAGAPHELPKASPFLPREPRQPLVSGTASICWNPGTGSVVWLNLPYLYGNLIWMKKTFHVDQDLFDQARVACGASTDTETIRLGLEALVRHAAYQRLRTLRGSEPRAQDVRRRREKPQPRRGTR